MLETVKNYCPYCGEPIQLVVDPSVDQQSYTEDCFVCCRPMIVDVFIGDEITLTTRREDE